MKRDGQERLYIAPCELDEANVFVRQHHRHHKEVIGHKFSIACAVEDDPLNYRICGVAIVGRPIARMSDDGSTLEVYRVATDGTKNACSFLYGACRRAAWALGYRRLITYTLKEESGASLRGAGFRLVGERGGGSWSRENRPRVDKHPTQRKLAWECSPFCNFGHVNDGEHCT